MAWKAASTTPVGRTPELKTKRDPVADFKALVSRKLADSGGQGFNTMATYQLLGAAVKAIESATTPAEARGIGKAFREGVMNAVKFNVGEALILDTSDPVSKALAGHLPPRAWTPEKNPSVTDWVQAFSGFERAHARQLAQ